MIFELREYDIQPGAMPEWIQLMQEHIHPYQTQLGIAFIASFISIDNPNKYIWIRRFPSEKERERLYQAVYESEHWKSHIKPHIDKMLIRDTMKVTLMEATAISPIH
ncbi:MAG: NIPSNAP family protein [Legionellales bacterium]